MIRWVLALCVLASPVWATQDGWPALYDVDGVAGDDVLNVRSAPSVSGEIVGTLSPEATNVEVIRPNEDLTWGLVNAGERTGWVSLAFLARHSGNWVGSMPNVRQCFGTEPFWSLQHGDAAILLSMPDESDRAGLISGRHRSLSRVDRFVYRGSFFQTNRGVQEITLALRVEACDDGMSDRAYGIGVDMLLTHTSDPSQFGLYSGCCTLAPPAQ